MSKKELGQFFTTHHEYILQNMIIPKSVKNIVEPFCGNGDLLKFIEKFDIKYNIECYDIEPKKKNIIKKDTLMNPPNYTGKYIITNPPYLARNKTSNKSIFDKYDVNDLYKCLIKELITNICDGGILIIPLNFWSSIRISDITLRKLFLDVYKIELINIFEENVFDDTSYTVCSFQFRKKTEDDNNNIKIDIYPSKKNINVVLNKDNNFTIGGKIYNLETSDNYKISRLTNKNKDKRYTNILVKCIDDNEDNKIGLSIVSDDDIYIDTTPKLSSRTYATLIIEPYIDIKKQKKLVKTFNKYLNKNREKYNSLFLTNYRESKDISRKRISFELVYQIVHYVLDKIDRV
jgi:hypothetical protein